MLHHFDHRWASCDRSTGHGPRANIRADDANNHSTPVLPRYWVAEEKVEDRLRGRWGHSWLLGWRLVCRSTDERTVIGTVLPRVGCGNSILLLCPETGSAPALAALVACLNSFALDFAARQKLGGINLNFHILKQLPVLPPSAYASAAPWSHDERLADWIARRVLELVYTAPDLQPFAADLSYYGPPFPWDGERRFHLRCQLDAAFFWLYGMNGEDAAYVLDTFPGVRRKDEKRFGEYRTKRVILEQLSLYRYFVDKGRGKR
jgi:hypothetical protein